MPQLTLNISDNLSVAEVKQISQAIKGLIMKQTEKPQTEAKKKVKAESLDPIEAEWEGSVSVGIKW